MVAGRRRPGTETAGRRPARAAAGGDEELSAAERARRERSRESGGGIVGYATDRDATVAAFALSGRLFLADLAGAGAVRELPAAGAVIDPRPDPTGTWVAYVADGGLHVVRVDGCETAHAGRRRRRRGHLGPGRVRRRRGDGPAPRLLVVPGRLARCWPPGSTTARCQRWYIADPAHPETPAAEVRYPAAGTANAEVTPAPARPRRQPRRRDVGPDGASRTSCARTWSEAGAVLLVMSRDQRHGAGARRRHRHRATPTLLAEQTDPVWLDVVPGVPPCCPTAGCVTTRRPRRRAPAGGRRRAGHRRRLQVEAVVVVGDDGVLLAGHRRAGRGHLWRWYRTHGVERLDRRGRLPHRPGARAATLVVAVQVGARAAAGRRRCTATGAGAGRRHVVRRAAAAAHRRRGSSGSAQRELRGRASCSRGTTCPAPPLPVLMDPYGGPHHREVVDGRSAGCEAQWLADQGFAVVVADGRGTPGRGPAWERAIRRRLRRP